ncbi:hypothetical protein [Acidisoma cladoniae]|jgi:hypothetical protein|uniref:hypothetical protein n=1 Tax=Acidisoma cladoniae TaxID=3040935 RepID=UPI00254CE92B|nr:hypothetical protein [Acidisoma sp. PAMC 29798]
MTSNYNGIERRRPRRRRSRTVLGILSGALVGGVCAVGLRLGYASILSIGPIDGFGDAVLRVFLLTGLPAGVLFGAAMGWRDVPQRGFMARLCWSGLGMACGGVLFGAAAFGLGLAYFHFFPLSPDEGGTGYALFLLILPAGIATGSISGAAAGWRLAP